MNRITLTLIYFLMIFCPLMGQDNFFKSVTNQEEIDSFIKALTIETAKIRNIKADFTQTKKVDFLNESVVSKGILFIAEQKRLRWEYEKPYSFAFIFNGEKAWMVNQGVETEFDVKSNKIFKELSELMMFGIGGVSLFENPNFDFSYKRSEEKWGVVLKPKTKEMRSLYSEVELIFSVDYQMECVRLIDTAGDETLIQLMNRQINTNLLDDLFHVKSTTHFP